MFADTVLSHKRSFNLPFTILGHKRGLNLPFTVLDPKRGLNLHINRRGFELKIYLLILRGYH